MSRVVLKVSTKQMKNAKVVAQVPTSVNTAKDGDTLPPRQRRGAAKVEYGENSFEKKKKAAKKDTVGSRVPEKRARGAMKAALVETPNKVVNEIGPETTEEESQTAPPIVKKDGRKKNATKEVAKDILENDVPEKRAKGEVKTVAVEAQIDVVNEIVARTAEEKAVTAPPVVKKGGRKKNAEKEVTKEKTENDVPQKRARGAVKTAAVEAPNDVVNEIVPETANEKSETAPPVVPKSGRKNTARKEVAKDKVENEVPEKRARGAVKAAAVEAPNDVVNQIGLEKAEEKAETGPPVVTKGGRKKNAQKEVAKEKVENEEAEEKSDTEPPVVTKGGRKKNAKKEVTKEKMENDELEEKAETGPPVVKKGDRKKNAENEVANEKVENNANVLSTIPQKRARGAVKTAAVEAPNDVVNEIVPKTSEEKSETAPPVVMKGGRKKKSKKEVVEEKVKNESSETAEGTNPNATFVITKDDKEVDVPISTIHVPSVQGEKVLKSAARSKKCLGYHVSAAGGVERAIFEAVENGCRSFAFFVRNQRRWDSPPMPQKVVDIWHEALKVTGFDVDQIVPHGSYLMNPGCPDKVKLEKTRQAMLDECQRAEKLGIRLYNFHPGSTLNDCTVDECLQTVAETINYIIDRTHSIVLVIETMAGQGQTVGTTFEEIKQMIDKVNNKSRVGVCIDTCHIFAAGYDIRTRDKYEETMQKFDDVIGFGYLKALHINDSKGGLGCRADRHEHLGKGAIGWAAFSFLSADPRLDGLPMILETPEGDYCREMENMYKKGLTIAEE